MARFYFNRVSYSDGMAVQSGSGGNQPMAVCGGAVGASSPQGQLLATLISKLQVVLLRKL